MLYQSQPFEIAHDKAIVAKWSTGKMGHTAIPIWDILSTAKSCEGISSGRFPGWASRFKGDQTLWGSPRWEPWSLLDPSIFWRTGVATLLRWCIENKSARACHSRVGVVLVSLQNYVILRAFLLTEPCSNNVAEYDVLLNTNRRWDWR